MFLVEFDRDDEDNENCVSLERLKNETLGLTKNDDDNLLELKTNRSDSVAEVKIPNTFSSIQPPFQSSSTPAHLDHRYMVWNSVGIVKGMEYI